MSAHFIAFRYKEFKQALKDPYADANAPDRIAAVGTFDKVSIEPKQITELADLEDIPEGSSLFVCSLLVLFPRVQMNCYSATHC